MEDVELLLTPEYVDFSKKIAELYALKKSLKDDFKKKYEEYQKSLKVLDENAKQCVADWEKWKSSQHDKDKKE
jgi:ABC-type Zn uptake system ZnuABC Zn-binding protein ZnuA